VLGEVGREELALQRTTDSHWLTQRSEPSFLSTLCANLVQLKSLFHPEVEGAIFTKHWYIILTSIDKMVSYPRITIQQYDNLKSQFNPVEICPILTLFMVMIELFKISVKTLSICHSPNPCI